VGAGLVMTVVLVLLLLVRVFRFVPIGLADELGQHAIVRRLATEAVAGLTVLGVERGLHDVLVIDRNFLASLNIIEFNAHFANPFFF
jgi:hypothetical protein